MHLHDLGQMGLADLVAQPRLDAAVGEFAAARADAGVLPFELARPRLRLLLRGRGNLGVNGLQHIGEFAPGNPPRRADYCSQPPFREFRGKLR